MYEEENTHSGSGFVGFLLGVVATVVVAFGLLVWDHSSREAPIRTAELSIPTPDITPPGVVPRSETSALPIQ